MQALSPDLFSDENSASLFMSVKSRRMSVLSKTCRFDAFPHMHHRERHSKSNKKVEYYGFGTTDPDVFRLGSRPQWNDHFFAVSMTAKIPNAGCWIIMQIIICVNKKSFVYQEVQFFVSGKHTLSHYNNQTFPEFRDTCPIHIGRQVCQRRD